MLGDGIVKEIFDSGLNLLFYAYGPNYAFALHAQSHQGKHRQICFSQEFKYFIVIPAEVSDPPMVIGFEIMVGTVFRYHGS